MSIFRRHRIGRRDAEHLLAGAPTPPGSDDLAGLLAALRGPRPADAVASGELPGEQAALAAYRAAFGPDGAALRTPPEETIPVRSLALRRALAVKVLAAGALTVGLGGAAMAATGMPLVPGGTHRSTTAAEHAASPSGSPSGRPTGSASPDDHGSASAAGKPSAVRPGLDARAALLLDCRNWLADHPKASPAPAQNQSGKRYADLVQAAGGQDGVAAYCAALAVEICPTAKASDAAGSGAVPGYLPGCPKPTPSAKGSHTRPAPSGSRTRPEPSRTTPEPAKSRPAAPSQRPSTTPGKR